MRKNSPMLALVLGAGLFIAGVVYLFLLRFEAGDVYPRYSSLRADPLGTMALAESLAKLPGLTVRRDVSSNGRLPEEKNTTYLHLAAETSDWRWMPADLANEIEAFATRGGRLVVTMFPTTRPDFWSPAVPFTFTPTNAPTTNAPSTNAPATKSVKKPARKKSNPKPDELLNQVSLQKRWGLEFAYAKLKQGANDVYEPAEVINQTDLPLPASLDWHSALVLTNLASSWRPIYGRVKQPVFAEPDPVVVERKFGRGSIIIATDSYFLSNEALTKDRQPALLAWLIGPATQVVFDEAHLGVVESSGIAILMRKYRLTGLIGALVLLALLFIWKNSTSLVPPHADVKADGYIAGKDATAGFVNLLRRNIPAREIMNVIFDEWTKSLLHRRNVRIASVDHAQTVMEAERALPPTARNPVRAYREISKALKSPFAQHATRNTAQESNSQAAFKPDTTA